MKKIKISCKIITGFLLLFLFANSVFAKISETIVKKIRKSTVLICSYDDGGTKLSTGSGFLVSDTGIIATNNHVLENAKKIIVKLFSGEKFTDIVIRDYDEVKDIALLKIKGFDLPYLDFGNSNSLKVGSEVYVCGNSLGDYEFTFSNGLLSGIRYSDDGFKYLQMSAPISPGNSGGPIVNDQGEVIGVSVASSTKGQNINFGVPINYIRGMIDTDKNLTLKKYSSVSALSTDHIVIGNKNISDLSLDVHPDMDISKRILIIPFSGFVMKYPTAGQEIFAAMVLRIKANYPKENYYVINYIQAKKAIENLTGDTFDKILKPLSKEKIKELAIRLRANTVICGHINHYDFTFTPVAMPFVGLVMISKAIMNIDYQMYKLDVDKIVIDNSFRRKQEFNSPSDSFLRIASYIVGKMKNKYKVLSNSNKHKNKPIQVKIVDGEPSIQLIN
jgi:hypothetical protein